MVVERRGSTTKILNGKGKVYNFMGIKIIRFNMKTKKHSQTLLTHRLIYHLNKKKIQNYLFYYLWLWLVIFNSLNLNFDFIFSTNKEKRWGKEKKKKKSPFWIKFLFISCLFFILF